MKSLLLTLYRVALKCRALLKTLLKKAYGLLVRVQAGSVAGHVHVGGFSKVTANTHLGHNVNFNGMHISGSGTVRIGDNFHSGEQCRILTTYHNYEGEAIPYDATYIHKDVTIEDNVWLGEGVMILGGVTIGEGAIIQARSVVVKDIPAGAIAGGHPAKVFKQRDMEHYAALQAKKAFH